MGRAGKKQEKTLARIGYLDGNTSVNIYGFQYCPCPTEPQSTIDSVNYLF